MSKVTIAIDVMGGDIGPSCTLPACFSCLKNSPDLNLILVGNLSNIDAFITTQSSLLSNRVEVIHTDEVVTMDDSVAIALRNKPRSSMKMALELVRDGKADACVSAGNTGALMALARYTLKTIAGIDRPAMMCALPTQQDGSCYLLDLGANVDCTAEQLLQFAVMGVVAAEVLGVVNPRVALLNVGTEIIKGNQQVKFAAQMFEAQDKLNYVGFVEGDGVYSGEVDVVVCDGFVGNVLLKASEGVLKLLKNRLENGFKSGWLSKLWRLMMFLPLLKRLQKNFSPERYNGATLLGLQGVVVKSHGAADINAFKAAIEHACTEINEGLQQRLVTRIEKLLAHNN